MCLCLSSCCRVSSIITARPLVERDGAVVRFHHGRYGRGGGSRIILELLDVARLDFAVAHVLSGDNLAHGQARTGLAVVALVFLFLEVDAKDSPVEHVQAASVPRGERVKTGVALLDGLQAAL